MGLDREIATRSKPRIQRYVQPVGLFEALYESPVFVATFSLEHSPMRRSLLSLFALAIFATPAFAGKYNSTVSVGQKAPDFSGIPAVLNGQDASISLADAKEDVVVLVFLGNHCPVVQAYEDRLIDFVSDYKGKSVKVIGVAVGPQEEDRLPGIKKYTAEKKSNYVYGYDETQAIGRSYGASKTPEFFVLDKDRNIRYMGAMDDNMKEEKVSKTYLRDAVDALLKGDQPPVEETRAVGCGVRYTK